MVAEWYYTDQGQQRGPVTFEQLQQRATSGLLKPADLVWKPGMGDWASLSSQPGLFGDGGAVPARPPRREFDELPDTDNRRTYERPRPAGVGAGLKIALFGGGAAVLLMALCCGVV